MSYPQIVVLYPQGLCGCFFRLWITQRIALGRAMFTGSWPRLRPLLPLRGDAESGGDESEADHDVPVVQLVDGQGAVAHVEDDDPGEPDEEHGQHHGRDPGTAVQLDAGRLLRRRRRVIG